MYGIQPKLAISLKKKVIEMNLQAMKILELVNIDLQLSVINV